MAVPDLHAFRQDVRAWIGENLPPSIVRERQGRGPRPRRT